MSQQLPPNDQPFVPPPPPRSSPYPTEELTRQAAYVAAETKTALILSIVGLFFAGFIFGFLAFRRASQALETIAIYDVAQEKKGLALTARVLSIVDIVGWVILLVLRFTLI